MKKFAAGILMLLAATTANGDAPHEEGSLNLEQEPIVVITTLFDTKRQLNAYLRRAGLGDPNTKYEGYARIRVTTYRDTETQETWTENVCHIYALRSLRDEDHRMTVLGHEFSHCLYGQFHSENQT